MSHKHRPKTCTNCRKLFPQEKIGSHTAYCQKFRQKCQQCSQFFDKQQLQSHIKQSHTVVCCPDCQLPFQSVPQLTGHIPKCRRRAQLCHYCQSHIKYSEFQEHLIDCGGRTRECDCGRYVRLREWDMHRSRCKDCRQQEQGGTLLKQQGRNPGSQQTGRQIDDQDRIPWEVIDIEKELREQQRRDQIKQQKPNEFYTFAPKQDEFRIDPEFLTTSLHREFDPEVQRRLLASISGNNPARVLDKAPQPQRPPQPLRRPQPPTLFASEKQHQPNPVPPPNRELIPQYPIPSPKIQTGPAASYGIIRNPDLQPQFKKASPPPVSPRIRQPEPVYNFLKAQRPAVQPELPIRQPEPVVPQRQPQYPIPQPQYPIPQPQPKPQYEPQPVNLSPRRAPLVSQAQLGSQGSQRPLHYSPHNSSPQSRRLSPLTSSIYNSRNQSPPKKYVIPSPPKAPPAQRVPSPPRRAPEPMVSPRRPVQRPLYPYPYPPYNPQPRNVRPPLIQELPFDPTLLEGEVLDFETQRDMLAEFQRRKTLRF